MAAVTEQVWLDSLQGGFSTISCEICDLEITPTRYVCYDSNFRKFLPLHLILQRQITDYESVLFNVPKYFLAAVAYFFI